MKLLVDIGNTRIKWGYDKPDGLESGAPIPYKQTDFIQQLQQNWNSISVSLLAISSAGHQHIVKQIIVLAKDLWPDIKVIIAKSEPETCSVANAYIQADKLGVDRWLGLIALWHFYPGYSCLVDCGTAITIDSLNDQGQHLGGLISPGLQLMKQSLYQEIKDLPFNSVDCPAGLADYTEAAIHSGVICAAAGLIEKAVNDLCSCQTLILTGGDAQLITTNLNISPILEPNFILKGLSLYCKAKNVS